MAAPMLVPLILLGGAALGLAAASSKKKGEAPAGTVKTYTLDTNLPAPLRDQVLAALATEQDPAKLEAFASAMAGTFPLAAGALRQKATMLRAGTLPQNPMDLLTGVPDPPRTQVMQQLMSQNDPNALEAYAKQLETAYPAAASALRLKEAVLRGQAPQVQPPTPGSSVPAAPPIQTFPTSPPPGPLPPAPPQVQPQPPVPGSPIPPATTSSVPIPPAVPPASTSTPPVGPATPFPMPFPPTQLPPPLLGGLDPGMPLEMQKAVVGALTTESDPAKLEGFASAIQAQYPVASGLLIAKAQALRLMRPPSVGVPVTVPVPSVPTYPVPQVPGSYPVGADSTRTGRNAGRPSGYPFILLRGESTYPAKIAQQATGKEMNYAQMSAINPQFAKDGVHWVNIQKGDALNIPWDWAPKLAGTYLIELDPGVAAPGEVVQVPVLQASQPPLALPPISSPSIPVIFQQVADSYKVVAGDSPSKIAKKLVGNANRWKELTAANPQKKTGADGNFTSLLPGEVLHLPASWKGATPILAAAGGSHAAHA